MKNKEYFDLSNYSRNSKYFCNDNKKILGKMKDEYDGNVIKEFIGLRSKMYSILHTKKYRKRVLKKGIINIKYEKFGDTLIKKLLDIKWGG